ncbi:FAD-binding protein [Haladaptatus sp. F3-133]|uniref:succinate dehydrogenase n=1 Tax=Halorutilus salinus TaxID=2487751 RepID=A0A9Q4GI40_9EURY|nr:FAD-binding protein [Halorutilus salinus]MCX2818438.1 FAD-binding protein [Halorutilus salinus]
MKKHDVLIVGAGGAGLRAAVAAHEAGADVAMVTKLHPVRSHTGAAEGGINAALKEEDDWKDHAYDTVKGSDYIGDQDAIETMTEEAPKEVINLENMGMAFSRDENGRVSQRAFGGLSFPRTTYASDKTGHMLLHTMYEQVMKRGVTVYDEWHVTNVVRDNGKCHGVVAYDIQSGEMEGFTAGATVFATGGMGQVFEHTTNAVSCTGDGMSMAYRAGVPMEDMEFVQFHPTTLPSTGILITEGCRGEGGILYNNKGERFMYEYGYAPNDGELASRDVVSRAELTEVQEGRGFADDTVHLDLTHFGEEKIEERLSQILELARDFEDVDPVTEPIPVKPGQHYSMGGIACNADGETELPGMYAVGEAACVSVHGANRLGGNALLELVVFGRLAGEHAANNHLTNVSTKSVEEAVKDERARIDSLMDGTGEHQSEIRQDVQDIMTEKVNVFRDEEGLMDALETIHEARERYQNVNVKDTSHTFNTDLTQTIELRSILDVAEAVTLGALERTESRGAHWRYENQERNDDDWLKHTMVYHTDDGPTVEYEDVEIKEYKPKARSY